MPDKKTDPLIEKKVLISVDGSLASFRSINYAAHMLGVSHNLNFVLLYVMPAMPPYLEEGVQDGPKIAKLRKIGMANQSRAKKIFREAVKRCEALEIPSDLVEIKTIVRKTGLAGDILNEAETGLYDALLIGRRGLSKTQEMIMGSVSQQLLQHVSKIPLWIIDGNVEKPRILVAVDGSDASLRAVDHVGFMFGSNPEAQVDFVHIAPKLQQFCEIDLSSDEDALFEGEDELEELEEAFRLDNEACLDDFFPKAQKILIKAGFTQDRMKLETKEVTLGVAKSIIKAAEEFDAGTIVVGRRGMGRSPFLGSVSDRVIKRVSNRAVWVVN